MGTRIRKILGYGLNDFEGKNDPRILPGGNLDNYFKKVYQTPAVGAQSYKEYLDSKDIQTKNFAKTEKYWVDPKKHEFGFYDVVKHDGEFGLPNILIIKPPTMLDWYRHDNVIDYYESENAEPTVKLLTSIYPFIGGCWCPETFEEVDKHPIWEEEEFKEGKFVTKVPEFMKYLCDYLQLFNEDVWKQLKPMIYTYWS